MFSINLPQFLKIKRDEKHISSFRAYPYQKTNLITQPDGSTFNLYLTNQRIIFEKSIESDQAKLALDHLDIMGNVDAGSQRSRAFLENLNLFATEKYSNPSVCYGIPLNVVKYVKLTKSIGLSIINLSLKQKEEQKNIYFSVNSVSKQNKSNDDFVEIINQLMKSR